jgi:hypothetical protein
MRLSVCFSTVYLYFLAYLSVCLSFGLSIFMPLHERLNVYLCVCLPVCLPACHVYLPVLRLLYLFSCLFFYLSVCLSVSLSACHNPHVSIFCVLFVCGLVSLPVHLMPFFLACIIVGLLFVFFSIVVFFSLSQPSFSDSASSQS